MYISGILKKIKKFFVWVLKNLLLVFDIIFANFLFLRIMISKLNDIKLVVFER